MNSPYRLAIETSNPSASPGPLHGPGVAIADAHNTILGVELLGQGNRHDDLLMPAIDRLTKRLCIAPMELSHIAVSVGPGGFTALRIAVATTKALSMATGALCIEVPSALVVARSIEPVSEPTLVCLCSKRESTHATVFENVQSSLGTVAGIIQADQLPGLHSQGIKTLVGDSFLPESMRTRAQELGMSIIEPRLSAVACLKASLTLKNTPADALAPMYAREPEAVRVWKTRKTDNSTP